MQKYSTIIVDLGLGRCGEQERRTVEGSLKTVCNCMYGAVGEIRMDDVMRTGKEYTGKMIKFQDTYQTSTALCFEFLNSVGV